MHYKAFLSLTLLGSSTAQILSAPSHHARGLHPRDVNNLPTIKSSLKHGAEGVTAVDNAFQAVTAANAKEQLKTANSAMLKLASDVTADMKKLKSSGAIGIGEILGLASEAPRNELIATISGLFTALNKTAITIGSKRDIIKASGAVDLIVSGIKAQREGLVAIVSIVPGQVPAIAKGPIDGIINNMFGAAKGTPPTGAAPPTPPTLRRRQTDGKAKGGAGKGGAGMGGAAKGGAGKGTAGAGGAAKGSSGSTSSSGGLTLESLLSSPQALESTGKAIDEFLDRVISWLRGTTDVLIPQEMLDAMAKGMPKGGPKGAAPPKAGGESGAAPPKASGESGAAPR